VDVPPLSIPSTSENISSSDDESEDENHPLPSQDPPSTPLFKNISMLLRMQQVLLQVILKIKMCMFLV